MRKVFLDDLPRKTKDNRSNGLNIDWENSTRFKVDFIYDNIKGWVEIIYYDIETRRIGIRYLDEPIFRIGTGGFKKCALGKLLGIKTDEFKVEVGDIFKDDKRNIIITDREYKINNKSNGYTQNDKWYKYTCNKCGWTEGWIKEGNLTGHKQGCSCCYGRTAVLGINTIWDTDRWMVDLGVSEEDAKKYTSNSHNKIIATCSDCGRIKLIKIDSLYKTHSISCTCSDKISYPNKFAYSLLNQLNEIYKFDYMEHEYSPDWIKPKRYDNYFIHNGKQYILEMDGGWHTKDNKMSGQTKEESKTIDNYKDLKAREHGIEVIRINCDKSELDYIKQNTFSSELNRFDLSKINWLKCGESALSNLVKVACEYKKRNPNMTTAEIGEIMKLNRHTVLKYLKQGTLIGWCSYDTKEEKARLSNERGVANGKQLEIFKDNISLGLFKSCAELERQSEELFGVKLLKSRISSVCNGKRPHHKGFTFKYINEIEQVI